jgi:glucose 1-dehydrogenase
MMNSLKKLTGKKVLITGAASGIGRATAIELAKAGADIAINYRPGERGEAKAKDTAEKICEEVRGVGCNSLLVPADVSLEEDVCVMFDKIISSWGKLDILINNAGIQMKSESHLLSLEDFNKVFKTNAIGTFLCSREAIKTFLKFKIRGVIINNTSVHQLIPKPQYLSYSMSKGAVQNLTRTLALEYASKGIRVNNVAPGAIVTPINPWAKDEDKKGNIEDHIPLGEVGLAEQIARGMLFLASDDSDYMTGQTLFIDGGLTLYPDFIEDWSSS